MKHFSDFPSQIFNPSLHRLNFPECVNFLDQHCVQVVHIKGKQLSSLGKVLFVCLLLNLFQHCTIQVHDNKPLLPLTDCELRELSL